MQNGTRTSEYTDVLGEISMRERKDVRIIPQKNMAVELVFAADTAAAAILGKKPVHTPGFTQPDHVKFWLGKIEQEISPFERADFSVAFSTVSSILFLFYQIIKNQITSIDELIDHLSGFTADQFLEASRELLHIDDQADTAWMTPEGIQKALEVDRMDIYGDLEAEARQLHHILSSPKQFLQRVSTVLSWFSQRYVLPYEQEITEHVNSSLAAHSAQLENQPVFVLDQLSSGNSDIVREYTDEIRLYVIYFLSDDVSILMPDVVHIIAGTEFFRHLLSKDQSDYTDEILKALNDPRRLAILRLLKQRSWFSKELADELNLTPATVSYHMDILFKAELIRIEHSAQRRYYYTINDKGVKKLIEGLKQEFIIPADM